MKIIAVLLNPTLDQIYEIENFAVGGTFKVNKSTLYPVGKAISFSLGVQVLSKKKDLVRVLAFIGENEIPLYSKFLKERGINFKFIKVKGKTRSNKTINDPIKGTTTHIREGGFKLDQKDLEKMLALIHDNVESSDLVVFSGSVPPNVSENIYNEMIKACKEKSALTILDSSGKALLEGVKSNPTIIKPNLVELSQILRDPKIKEVDLSNMFNACKQIIEVAKKLLNDDLKIVLITLGDKGAICLTRNERFYGNVRVEGVIDTVGSGDSFLAGFLLNYTNNKDLLQCFKLAIASGAANTLIPGPGIFEKESVEKIIREVKILELD